MKNIYIIIIILLFIIIGCGDNIVQNNDLNSEKNIDSNKEITEINVNFKGKIIAGKTTPYLEFNQEDYEKALSENKIILKLFF